jgi:hypothetical protein
MRQLFAGEFSQILNSLPNIESDFAYFACPSTKPGITDRLKTNTMIKIKKGNKIKLYRTNERLRDFSVNIKISRSFVK